MSIIEKIDQIGEYAASQLGVRLKEFWLTSKECDQLRAELDELFGDMPMVKMNVTDPHFGEFHYGGLVIKTIGLHDRKCTHRLTSHFRDVNEIYCHDCRTIVGTGEPETHKRNSTI